MSDYYELPPPEKKKRSLAWVYLLLLLLFLLALWATWWSLRLQPGEIGEDPVLTAAAMPAAARIVAPPVQAAPEPEPEPEPEPAADPKPAVAEETPETVQPEALPEPPPQSFLADVGVTLGLTVRESLAEAIACSPPGRNPSKLTLGRRWVPITSAPSLSPG
jgi:cytoskeletal protein RodZ